MNEQMHPLGRHPTMSRPVSFSRLRINHYRTRSLQEAREKLARPMAANGKLRLVWDHDKLSELLDETITIYVPALRDALGVRA